MSAPARVVEHLGSRRSAAWLAGPTDAAGSTPAFGDRYPTLVDDAIAWIHAARCADDVSTTVSTLPLLDFLG